ncbi:MAG: ADP-dependent NAD(P)H-hydrate dehydratase / NAD(P)H-hydrate epimerase [Nocardioidaceae bacterium]|nr:ADP-dependent NAD(P)H-hydrate dehydratase / NAD(P)H-hydrate epimerase [Nocardioidaceae bacterium]
MRSAYTVEQIRRAEGELMATLPTGALMQRAAAGLATACAQFLGGVYGARLLVLAGSGANGGDALYAAARLVRRGARAEAVLLGETAHEGGLAEFVAAGGYVVAEPGQYDVVLDAIVGIGGRGGLDERAAGLVDGLTAPVVAVDVPSGIGVDSGELAGPHVEAAVTVTFGTHKVGLFVDPAAQAAGSVALVDIGLGPYLGDPAVQVLQDDDVRRLMPRPAHDAQKYSRGLLGIEAGSAQYTGAGLLVTSAAVATGLAGMVRYNGGADALVRSAHPEVVIGPGQVQAHVVGPGLGQGQGDTVRRVLADGLPTVVDADALAELPARCSSPVVLTPHAGELARMLDRDRTDVEARMLAAATTAAKRWDAVVVLKGARAVIAAPDGRIRVNTTGVPWLATAGAGDVLAGITATLLAAGLDCFDAASVGAWLHGSAATLASRGGPLSATSVVASIPDVLRAVLT